LVAFINAHAAKEWSNKPEAERKQSYLPGNLHQSKETTLTPFPLHDAVVLKQLGEWFGKEALEPMGYHEKDWHRDEWAGGCPVASFGPGALTAPGFYDALRSPSGRIYWCGTETATVSQGFLEGAVNSAFQVVHLLANQASFPIKSLI